MAIVENPLSDEELDAICRAPRVTKEMTFGKALAWLEKYHDHFANNHAGQYVLVNAKDLTYVLAENHDKANRLYEETYGPLPPEGRSFVGQQMPAPRT